MSHKLFRSLFVLIFVLGFLAIQSQEQARAASSNLPIVKVKASNTCPPNTTNSQGTTVTIDWTTFPNGSPIPNETEITNQFQSLGLVFLSPPGPPRVLDALGGILISGGSSGFFGETHMSFVNVGYGLPTSLTVEIIGSGLNISASLEAFDINGDSLGIVTHTYTGNTGQLSPFTFSAPEGKRIARAIYNGGLNPSAAASIGTLIFHSSAIPCLPVLDDFNRPDGLIGDNWTRYTSKYLISDDQLLVWYSGSNTDIYWHEEFGADQEAFVTFTHINETGVEQNLLLKAQSNTTWGDGVLEVLYDAPGHNVQVWTWEWPQGWVKYGDDIPVTFMAGDTFKSRARPNGIVEVYQNGVLLGTRDVTSWSHYAKGGYIGLWFIDADGTLLDNFGGGNVPEGATGTIVINKYTVPQASGASGFEFTDDIVAPNQFSLNDGESIIFSDIEAGTYTVTENDPYDLGYFLTDLVCVDSDGGGTPSTVDLYNGIATINLDPGETVECTYTNSQFGRFRIIKDTVPDAAQDFTFNVTGLASDKSITLDDDGIGPPFNIFAFIVLPGRYTVTEDDPSGFGYALTDLVCVDSDGTGTASTVDLSSRTATINLDPGETVECTFTNSLQFGLIRIIKDTVPDGPQDFSFTTTGLGLANFTLDDDNVGPPYNIFAFAEVLPGSYTVTEDDPSGFGYALTDLVCEDSDVTGTASTVDLISRTATINLDAQETVECTFTNTKEPD